MSAKAKTGKGARGKGGATPKPKLITAWAWASGRIEFGAVTPANPMPSGALPIATGVKAKVVPAVTKLANIGEGSNCGLFLVPGVSGDDQGNGVEALIEFTRAVKAEMEKREAVAA